MAPEAAPSPEAHASQASTSGETAAQVEAGHACGSECSCSKTETNEYAANLFDGIGPANQLTLNGSTDILRPINGAETSLEHTCGANCSCTKTETNQFAASLFGDTKPTESHTFISNNEKPEQSAAADTSITYIMDVAPAAPSSTTFEAQPSKTAQPAPGENAGRNSAATEAPANVTSSASTESSDGASTAAQKETSTTSLIDKTVEGTEKTSPTINAAPNNATSSEATHAGTTEVEQKTEKSNASPPTEASVSHTEQRENVTKQPAAEAPSKPTPTVELSSDKPKKATEATPPKMPEAASKHSESQPQPAQATTTEKRPAKQQTYKSITPRPETSVRSSEKTTDVTAKPLTENIVATTKPAPSPERPAADIAAPPPQEAIPSKFDAEPPGEDSTTEIRFVDNANETSIDNLNPDISFIDDIDSEEEQADHHAALDVLMAQENYTQTELSDIEKSDQVTNPPTDQTNEVHQIPLQEQPQISHIDLLPNNPTTTDTLENGTNDESMEDTVDANPDIVQQVVGFSSGENPSESAPAPAAGNTDTHDQYDSERIVQQEKKTAKLKESFVTAVSKLEAHQHTVDHVKELLASHRLTLPEQQTEQLIAFLKNHGEHLTHEYLAGLHQLMHKDNQQEGLTTSDHTMTKRFQLKQRRLQALLRKFLPGMLSPSVE